ncbi:ribosomal protein L10 [Mycoplasmoides fastidiosum]|uniref:Large ribosomal subunit protein uL10 n=1 Tax=Mycoplasmoides fastidiosum TaxID=92758 RepID=A0ABU0LZQ3_9BACT|nr:50S ribosomal protein L10 [Mycoplasmoides fastidiosum]MDQ0514065.1 ribosomal protein L10 [Mycoplasmoides fastidiosum]UUD37524.1 50S ribosomal protein L10 [Mycoplasmoides fastidiosum]
MSKKIHDYKASLVNELADKLKSCQSFLIYEYAGFTAKEASKLRDDLIAAECQMTVYKNNIMNRALKQSGIYSEASFTGPNALVLGGENIEPLKAIAKMAKTHKFIKLKAALVDGNLMLADQLTDFVNLPTKKDLYAMLCQCLQAPLRKFMHVVKAVGEAKPQ